MAEIDFWRAPPTTQGKGCVQEKPLRAFPARLESTRRSGRPLPAAKGGAPEKRSKWIFVKPPRTALSLGPKSSTANRG